MQAIPSRVRILEVLDAIALVGIVNAFWGIDVAVFAPQLMFPWLHWGTYLLLLYIQGIAAGLYLYLRLRGALRVLGA